MTCTWDDQTSGGARTTYCHEASYRRSFGGAIVFAGANIITTFAPLGACNRLRVQRPSFPAAYQPHGLVLLVSYYGCLGKHYSASITTHQAGLDAARFTPVCE
ncbi:hypothetical protein P389DRAFT_59297 [Cystobasidium minutum MCA 4210]|uniref:uncharacterized protein n=1 Tax=Cystobasidium minutum MCA 4210 TaxID=1397322 RepID=UPI0034CDAF36|eukprot:jgi/Rhomi1/59297/CE59296_40